LVLQFLNGSNANVSNNTFNSIGAGNSGLWVFTVQDAVAPTISNNTVTAGAQYGYAVFMTSTAGGLTIQGGSVTGATGAGVLLTNDVSGAPFGISSGPLANQSSRLNLSGVTLTGNAIGVSVLDSPADTN